MSRRFFVCWLFDIGYRVTLGFERGTETLQRSNGVKRAQNECQEEDKLISKRQEKKKVCLLSEQKRCRRQYHPLPSFQIIRCIRDEVVLKVEWSRTKCRACTGKEALNGVVSTHRIKQLVSWTLGKFCYLGDTGVVVRGEAFDCKE